MPFGGRDPFANDPFFSDSGFGRIDNMMKNMRQDMHNMMNSHMMIGSSSGSGPG